MKIQTELLTNLTFEKLKKADLENLVFNTLIKPIGKAAKKKVDDAFKNNKDINGEPYPPYTSKYQKAKTKAGKGGNPQMVFYGDLKKSISKVLTNKKEMTVTIKSDESKLGQSSPYKGNGQNYGRLHLIGQANSNRQTPKIRKWFFTSDELEDNKILLEENLLGKEFQQAKEQLTVKLQSLLKTRMRNLGKVTLKI